MKQFHHVTRFVAGCGIALAALALTATAEDKKDAPKPYPLKTCVVSGEKLGEMGKSFDFVYEGQEIKLCCKSCKKDFDKEPAKFVKKLQEAEKPNAEKKAGQ